MRKYYLCNPDDQAISGPHAFDELIRRAQSGEITPDWFVAEPGSEQFTALWDSFSLHEILFHGGAVPVEPPPVASHKMRGGPAKVESSEDSHPQDLINHHAEFAKVIEKSQLSTKPKPKLATTPKAAAEKTTPEPMPQGALTSETVLQAARDDFTRVLKKHDDDHFNPPTYWQSPAGERMRSFLWAEGCVALLTILLLVFLWLVGGLNITTIIYLTSFYVMLAVGFALIIFFLLS